MSYQVVERCSCGCTGRGESSAATSARKAAFVRDSTGQATDRLHFLGLAQIQLQPIALPQRATELERHRHLVRECLQERGVLGTKAAFGIGAVEVQHADRLLVQHQRDDDTGVVGALAVSAEMDFGCMGLSGRVNLRLR